ncbi:MAG: helix-turn-helix domain-containing protein [Cyclobacteriaceae bacterium]
MLLILYSSAANIILAFLLLFFNKIRNSNTIYLFLLLLFIAIHGVLQASIMNKGPLALIIFLFNNFSPLYFLIGPMLYFYVRGTVNDSIGLSKRDLVHFLPAALVLLNVVPYWFTSWDYKYQVGLDIIKSINTVRNFNDNWLIPSSLNFLIRGVLLLSYIIFSFHFLFTKRSGRSKTRLIPQAQKQITYAWLKILLLCMLLATVGYFMSSLVLILFSEPEAGLPNILFIVFNYICFVPLLIIPVALLFFPQILYGIPAFQMADVDKVKTEDEEKQLRTPSSAVEKENSSQDDFPVPDDYLEADLINSANSIMEHIKTEKPYLDKNFTMDKLTQSMGLPRHHIYFCMNRVLKVSFPDLRKQFRIQYAKQLLEEGRNKVLTMEGIGDQSGFSSRSNFFTAFKNEVGCTPTEYLERLSKK